MSSDRESVEGKYQSRSITSLKTAVAIGSTVTIGLGVYLLIGNIYKESGTQAPGSYLLIIFFSFLVILAVAERASATQGKGGLFSLSRSSRSIPIAYTTGWILLGGLIFLTAIFAWEGGLALQRSISLIFEYTIDGRILSALILLLVLPRLFLRSESQWKKRTLLVYLAIFILIILVISAWRKPLEFLPVYVYLPTSRITIIVPFLLITLWSLHFVLDHRDELRKPGRTILPALLLPLVLGGLLGSVLALVLLEYTTLTYYDNLPLVSLAEQYNPLLGLLILLSMIVFGVIGVNESLSSTIKLSKAMARDGFLPEDQSFLGRTFELQKAIIIFLTAVALVIILLGKSVDLIGVSAICLLLATVLVNMQDILNGRIRLPENRPLRMPLHPLVPLLAVAIGLTGIFMQSLDAFLIAAAWLFVGIIYFVLHAREGGVRIRQEEDILGTTTVPIRKTGYRVLTAVSDPVAAPDLIQLSLDLAESRGGLLTLLHVIPASERNDETELQAQNMLQKLTEAIESIQQRTVVTIVPQVRIAPSAAQGILNTLWEEQIDSIILGWPNPDENDRDKDDTTSQIVRGAQSQVVILHGTWPEKPCRLLIPTLSAEHSAAALELARSLKIDNDDCRIVALQPFVGKENSTAESQAGQQLENTLAKLNNLSGIEKQVLSAKTNKDGILSQADKYDCLLMGLSDEGFLAPTRFAGMGVEIAGEIAQPILLVATQENAARYWLRRTWDQLTSNIPALTKRQQSTVSTAMRLNARASIDYHVLISLATAIAFLGLIQNSAAVIIGAMLVAPLMNPILSIAHGIVKGRVKMLREAANTTLNGVVIAITIGVLLTLILLAMGYPLTPTSEILARTQPNLLDLLVALASGAVAAYAVSRSEVAGALPGVAIAAALVPPLAVVGYGLGTAQFDIAGGSSLLFLTNLAAIVLAAAIVFLMLGFRPTARVDREEQARFGMKIAIISLIIISIPLILTTRTSSNQTSRDATITNIMVNYWPPNQAQVENINISNLVGDDLKVDATIFDYAGVVTNESLAKLQTSLSNAVDEEVTLVTNIIDARQLEYNDNSAARQLTVTPTPSMTPTVLSTPTLEVLAPIRSTDTPAPPPTSTPIIINTPTISATQPISGTSTVSPELTPTLEITATQLPEITPTPEIEVSETANPETTATLDVPMTETPLPQPTETPQP